jgi:uncharacterized protein (DUF2235 family)
MVDHRNIVVAFDGTGNNPELNDTGVSHKSSNVYKLHQALMNKPKSNPTVKIYRQGVGTQYGEGVTGNALGINLENKIQSAYRRLQQYLTDENYNENRIFVIGFSRGAYAARRFCHLLNFSGIPQDVNDWGLGWNNFINQSDDAENLKQSGDFLNVEIEMLGVWDTVKAAPISDIKDKFIPANVKNAYHAISIDERREIFDILRFDPDEKVREVWFSGVHSDVGGSYEEHGLSDITLKWMIAHAYNHGLEFRGSSLVDMLPSIKPEGERHDESTKLKWILLGHIDRIIKEADLIHYTVKERIASIEESYNPVNLPDNPVFVDEDFA